MNYFEIYTELILLINTHGDKKKELIKLFNDIKYFLLLKNDVNSLKRILASNLVKIKLGSELYSDFKIPNNILEFSIVIGFFDKLEECHL